MYNLYIDREIFFVPGDESEFFQNRIFPGEASVLLSEYNGKIKSDEWNVADDL